MADFAIFEDPDFVNTEKCEMSSDICFQKVYGLLRNKYQYMNFTPVTCISYSSKLL